MFRRFLVATSNLFLAVFLVAGLLFVPAASVRAAPPIAETFMNGTASGWSLIGDAVLTSGGDDSVGEGWLRLTSAVNNQAGSAIYDTAFSSTDGVQVTFQYATYGGTGSPNGADGLSFYLIDGATGTPTVGAVGGSLGYSWNTVDTPNAPGVTNGYVGIGLDEWGNFSESGYGDCNPSCPGRMSNSLTIRGSGSLSTGFNYLTRAGVSPTITTDGRAGAKWVRITIPPGSPLLITVEIDSGSGFQTVIDGFDLSSASGQAPLPATFKMGFSASTGGATNYHEIRNLTVSGAEPSSTLLVSTPNPSARGQDVLLTATVSGAGSTPAGDVTFYDGSTLLGTGTLDGSGVATLTTSALAEGMHTLRAVYGGDSQYGSSEGTTSHEVILPYNTTTSLASSVNPSMYGTMVTFTATVSADAAGAGTPVGTVTFYDGGTPLGTIALDGSGQAGFTTAFPMAVGTHNVTAAYNGNAYFNPSTSPILYQRVEWAADLTIEKSMEVVDHTDVTFTIVARNMACCCVSAPGAIVSDTMPANVVDVTWTCEASGGARCGAPTGTGDIYDVLDVFPPGGVATYTVHATLVPVGHVSNTAQILVPEGVRDIDMSNNSATCARWYYFLPVVGR